MPNYIGSNQLTKMYLGDTEIVKAYIGGQEVYSSAPAGPVNYGITQKSILEHNTTQGRYSRIDKLDDNHVVISYVSTSGLEVKVFTIASDLSVSETSSLLVDAAGTDGIVTALDSSHFAVAYTGSGYDGYIASFSVDAEYAITKLYSREHDDKNGLNNSLVLVDATHLILACRGSWDRGCIKTFAIDGSYNITDIHLLTHDNAEYTGWNSLGKLDDSHYALAYLNNAAALRIKVFTIDGSYNITATSSLTAEADTVSGIGSLSILDSSHFAVSYTISYSLWQGNLKTFSVDAANSYTITCEDTLRFSSGKGQDSSLIALNVNHLMVAYADSDFDGQLLVFSLDASHDITKGTEIEHDTVYARQNSLVLLTPVVVALAYSCDGDDGCIKVFELD